MQKSAAGGLGTKKTVDTVDYLVLKIKTASLARLLCQHQLFAEDLRCTDALGAKQLKQLLLQMAADSL
ncbi:hypothetical protein P2G88_15680 [Aliiglaciecola sp. CAU 1673]|uniref:hypothetical protein n=1 Tax=Aliiglaciecola sp. CAU 1673 TaxID=3032595 RepID=UPI0023DB9B0F|nr:hypothetical protein [Aliiglaciecola sp. CAU 1673]MDF2179691.1 hypothetical protein [Aliiglaciecola sp. CAU 1673]